MCLLLLLLLLQQFGAHEQSHRQRFPASLCDIAVTVIVGDILRREELLQRANQTIAVVIVAAAAAAAAAAAIVGGGVTSHHTIHYRETLVRERRLAALETFQGAGNG